jgi:hypothetical protein
MLRKECEEVLKQSLFFVLVTLIIALLIKMAFPGKLGTYLETFSLLFQPGLLLLALFMGNSLFLTDRKQGAVDYLFCLPYSRLQLLGIKVLPRAIALVVFYVVYLLLGRWQSEFIGILNPLSLAYMYMALFIIGLSLSASLDNYVMMAALSLIVTFLFLQLFYWLPYLALKLKGVVIGQHDLRFLFDFRKGLSPGFPLLSLAYTCLLLPFLISFISTFKRIGLGSIANFNRRYAKIFIPIFAAGTILSYFPAQALLPPAKRAYYLTGRHQLIESDFFSTRIYDGAAVSRVKGRFIYRPHMPIEHDGYLYANDYLDGYRQFVRLNLNTRETEILYRNTKRDYSNLRPQWLFENTLAAFEDKFELFYRQMAIIDMETREVKKITLPDKLPERYYKPRLFGADRIDGRRFWLICSLRARSFPVFRLWEDGRIENLGMTGEFPGYFNHLLFTYSDEGLVIRRLTPACPEPVRVVPLGQKMEFFSLWRSNLNHAVISELYGRSHEKGRSKYFKLDLTNWQLLPLQAINNKTPGPDLKAYFMPTASGDGYYFEYNKQQGRYLLYRYRDEKLVFLREFVGLTDGDDRFGLFEAGIFVKKGKTLSAYLFPDLKRINFNQI